MSTIESTADPRTIEWGHQVRDAFLLEQERVKHLPEFIEWARETVSEPVQTDEGWIPGWTIEDCARKWVRHNLPAIPPSPLPTPAWSQEREVEFEASDITIVDAATVTVGGVDVRMTRTASLVLESEPWPDGSRVDEAGSLFIDAHVYVSAGEEIEITDATPERIRAYGAALSSLAEMLDNEAN